MRLRRAKLTDAKDLFELRQECIEFCFGDMPTWEEHVAWLSNTLGTNVIILIVEVDGVFAGQVKLSDDDPCDIGISLKKEFRGTGSKVIEEAVKYTKKDVIALIKRNNIPSLKAFVKAGFGV